MVILLSLTYTKTRLFLELSHISIILFQCCGQHDLCVIVLQSLLRKFSSSDGGTCIHVSLLATPVKRLLKPNPSICSTQYNTMILTYIRLSQLRQKNWSDWTVIS